MKALLIYPETPATFWSFKHILSFISKKAAFPPLGLLTVAALLPPEWELRLVDLNVSKLTDSDLVWADLVLISAMIIQKESAQEVIKRCRDLNRPILAGGPLFSAQPDNYPEIDHIVVGEAENTISLFLADWSEGHAKKIYRSSDWPNLELTPLPRWDLINLNDYVTMTVQFARGCPFDCEFCDIIIQNGQRTRTKTPEQFVLELESLYDRGWRGSVFVADDNLIGNKRRARQMLRSLVTWQEANNFPLRFLTQTSVNLAADDELLQLMSAANFYKVFLGLETPNVDSLLECGKTQNLKRSVVTAVKKIQAHGMQVMSGFIVGFDTDQVDIFDQQKKFIESLGVVVAMVGILTALPGTRLYNRLKDENRLLAESTGGNTDKVINFIPKMDKDLLLRKYDELVKDLYSVRSYYRRINTFLRDYFPTVRGTKIEWTDVKALLKSSILIGLFSRARFRYWSLIIRTAIFKTKALPAAVELTIQGYHFSKVVSRL